MQIFKLRLTIKLKPMKKLLFIIFLLSYNLGFSQEKDINNSTINCEAKFKELSKNFKEKDCLLKLNNFFIDSLKQNITKVSIKKIDSTLTLNINISKKLDSIYSKFTNYKIVCSDIGVKETLIDSLFPHQKPKKIDEKPQQETEDQVYIYFGKDQVIKEDVIDKSTTEGRILNEILKEKNEENYFGNIIIPKENQEFKFVVRNPNKKEAPKYINDDSLGTYKFKKIDIEIKDGMFTDIKCYVTYKGNTHIFENQIAHSFLRFSSFANAKVLDYKQTIKNTGEFKLTDMEGLQIRLGDVLVYNYKIGNNYIPHNLTLELPAKDDNGNKTNTAGATTYQIKQKTYLDKIIELRAYTDFLALLDEGNNGLVQFEANAKLYAFPFSHRIAERMQVQLFPSVSPFVHYSRFEKDNRFIEVTSGSLENGLELVEKRFLTMGLELEALSVFHKDYPASAHVYGLWGYQLSELKTGEDTFENIRASNYGFGLNLKFKRFNNFGFDYKVDLTWHDYKNFNNFENINLPNTIPVFRNQAEVFYHPTASPNSAIFMRLSTYNYKGSGNDQAFYQFQFGYKFSIGSRTVTKE